MEQTPKTEGLLSIEELSNYLSIKSKTLYAKVESGQIPHYKIGRLVRFKVSEIEAWLEGSRSAGKGAPCRIRRPSRPTRDIDRIIQKAIDESRREAYTSSHGKSDQIKGLGKEV